MKTVFITGVSSGIGQALAQIYLARGCHVCGLSRRRPADLASHPNFHFAPCDLTQLDRVAPAVRGLLDNAEPQTPPLVFLNAGAFGGAPQRADETTLSAFQEVMSLNVMAVKAVLDVCLQRFPRPECVVFSASLSALRPRAGMLSYAVSKAALNTLAKVYQLENPDVFFAVLGLCTVDTDLAHVVMQADARFEELIALRDRALQPGYLAKADERARDMAAILDERERLGLQSGQFREVRELAPLLMSAGAPMG